MFEVSVEKTFASAHALRNYHGKCENVHGHNYRVQITVQGEKLASNGLLIDFVEVKRLMNKVVEYLDHRHINELPPFTEVNPTAENIAKYFYDEMSGGMSADVPVRISEVRIWETDTSMALYRP